MNRAMAMVGILGIIFQVAGAVTGEEISQLGNLIAIDVVAQDILPGNVLLVAAAVDSLRILGLVEEVAVEIASD